MPLQPPPTDKLFTSADEAFQALQDHAREEAYAIVKKRPSSYENNLPGRYDISCMKIVQRKDTGDQWVPGILCPDHNHAPLLAVNFPINRRAALTEEQKHNIEVLLEKTKLSARAIIELMKKQYPDILLTEKDVWNIRQKKKKWIGVADLNAEVIETPLMGDVASSTSPGWDFGIGTARCPEPSIAKNITLG
ncbi:hypothetical protein HDV63DRAFT_398684 [Trichoderma sp. SZMC 28014]